MILTTHSIVGAGVASLVTTNPILGFFVGFLSHYVLDAIPHWDYKLLSYEKSEDGKTENLYIGKNFYYDLLRIFRDIAFGLLITLLFLWDKNFSSFPLLFSGAIGGIMPDALQLVYLKYKKQPLVLLHKIHNYFHTKINWKNKPLPGLLTQIIVILIVFALTK